MSEMSWKLLDERACIHIKMIETRSEKGKVLIEEQTKAKDRKDRHEKTKDNGLITS